MSDGTHHSESIQQAEHLDSDVSAKRVVNYVWTGTAHEAETGYAEDYRFSGGKSAYAATLNTSGDNTVITPASGKRIRIFWVAFVPDSDNATANLVTVSIGATAIYKGYALAHWEVFTGAADETVVINLANTGTVAVTIHYQEIT